MFCNESIYQENFLQFDLEQNYQLESLLDFKSDTTCQKKRRVLADISNHSKRPCIDLDKKYNNNIEKRNARERNRVKNLNKEFHNLQEVLFKSNNSENLSDKENNFSENGSIIQTTPRVSKLKLLRFAIDRIRHLTEVLQDKDVNTETFSFEKSICLSDDSYEENNSLTSEIRDSFSNNMDVEFLYFPRSDSESNQNWSQINNFHNYNYSTCSSNNSCNSCDTFEASASFKSIEFGI